MDSSSWTEPPPNFSETQRFDHLVSLRRWWRAVIVALFWLLALAILALWSANPVTLNRVQIQEAESILKVTVEDWSAGRMRVSKAWKRQLTDEQVQITGLPQDSQPTGTILLIPVTNRRDQWTVTPSPLPNHLPLIYPATPDAERQLQSLLNTGRLPDGK